MTDFYLAAAHAEITAGLSVLQVMEWGSVIVVVAAIVYATYQLTKG